MFHRRNGILKTKILVMLLMMRPGLTCKLSHTGEMFNDIATI